jgi:hypothetical protein
LASTVEEVESIVGSNGKQNYRLFTSVCSAQQPQPEP